MNAIKKQFRIQWRDWIWGPVVALGFAVGGMLLFWLIARLVGLDDGTYFDMGTLMGGMVGGMFCLFMTVGQLCIGFESQIAMGSTRKQFFVSYLLFCLAANEGMMLLLIGICAAENVAAAALYRGLRLEADFLPYLIRYGFFGGFLLTAVGDCAALC